MVHNHYDINLKTKWLIQYFVLSLWSPCEIETICASLFSRNGLSILLYAVYVYCNNIAFSILVIVLFMYGGDTNGLLRNKTWCKSRCWVFFSGYNVHVYEKILKKNISRYLIINKTKLNKLWWTSVAILPSFIETLQIFNMLSYYLKSLLWRIKQPCS